jgi:hypothetical protein
LIAFVYAANAQTESHSAPSDTHLAETHLAVDQTGKAREAWCQALTILDGTAHPDTQDLRTRFEALSTT